MPMKQRFCFKMWAEELAFLVRIRGDAFQLLFH